jgi:hypothetical protein
MIDSMLSPVITSVDNIHSSTQQHIYKAGGIIFLLMLSVLSHAQSGESQPATHRQANSQGLTKERLQSGYQTPVTGWIVHRGDTLQLGRGTRAGKEFTYLYQYDTAARSASRKYLPAAYSGRKVILKEMRAKGGSKAKSGLYVLLAVAGQPLYYANLDSAINGGEILPPIRNRPSAQSSPAVPVVVARGLIKLKAQLKAGQISQSEYEVRKKKLLD